MAHALFLRLDLVISVIGGPPNITSIVPALGCRGLGFQVVLVSGCKGGAHCAV